ncbi:hypothetical protein [Corynebacterium senegalense]|uniref:hypothetical protein n=1 Tax=Corynebacterium senegalense TaxID=2080750 RepID=UPI0011C0240C|nr:hypothetical protein [Corynebacterium senegalense]
MAEKFWVVRATLSDGRLAVINPELNVLTLWPAFGGEDSRWQVERVSDGRIVASHRGETRMFDVVGPVQEVDLHTAARTVVRVLREQEATIEGEV